MNEIQIKALIKALEVRKKQIYFHSFGESYDTEGIDLTYKIHSGHHTRDILTVLAVLKGEPEAEDLLNNMPKKEGI